MYLVYLVNLSWSRNTRWSKGGVTSIFWAPDIALLLLLLLMVTLPCLLLSPEDKTLYFCAKIYFHEKYLQVFKALCWMKRVSSWSRKSFLHSPHVKVSPPTTVGSGEGTIKFQNISLLKGFLWKQQIMNEASSMRSLWFCWEISQGLRCMYMYCTLLLQFVCALEDMI